MNAPAVPIPAVARCGICGLSWTARPGEFCPRCELEAVRIAFGPVAIELSTARRLLEGAYRDLAHERERLLRLSERLAAAGGN